MNKLNELKCFQIEKDLDIIAVNETWLNSCIPDNFILDNFHIFRKDRSSRGGGVLIAVRNSIKCSEKIVNNDFENIFVEIFINSKKFLICTLYKPPNQTNNFKDYLQNLFEIIDINFYDMICF